jgi:hypothetical protein
MAAAAGSILALLSALHFYWAAGGTRGKAAAVPARDGKALFHPSKRATAGVAVLLAIAAAMVFAGLRPAEWVLALIFGARAIGDGRWVGLFKRVRGTPFATLDTFVYSPLAAALCLSCLYAAL